MIRKSPGRLSIGSAPEIAKLLKLGKNLDTVGRSIGSVLRILGHADLLARRFKRDGGNGGRLSAIEYPHRVERL